MATPIWRALGRGHWHIAFGIPVVTQGDPGAIWTVLRLPWVPFSSPLLSLPIGGPLREPSTVYPRFWSIEEFVVYRVNTDQVTTVSALKPYLYEAVDGTSTPPTSSDLFSKLLAKMTQKVDASPDGFIYPNSRSFEASTTMGGVADTYFSRAADQTYMRDSYGYWLFDLKPTGVVQGQSIDSYGAKLTIRQQMVRAVQ